MKVGLKQSALIAAVAAASPLLFDVSSARAQNVSNSTWLLNSGGAWTTATNWDSDPASDPDTVPNYPNGAGSSATMTLSGTQPSQQDVTLGVPTTIGALSMTNNSTRIFAIAGTTTNNLTFDAASGNATISIAGTSTQPSRLNSPMVFNDTVVVNVVGDV